MVVLFLAVAGFTPGPQTSEHEAREQASFVPELQRYYSKPTVETSATYDDDADTWRIVLTEEVSRKTVARFAVVDDTGRAKNVKVSSKAAELTYPSLSEQEAVKLALADERVKAELSKHGPYTTRAEYDDGQWTVHFYVDESGLVGGSPWGHDRKEVARVGVNDTSWDLDYAWVGDQVGWAMARGEEGAYGKQANYFYIWGPMALVFALAFLRTDKLFSVRNLDVLALLSFLISHAFFREGIVFEAVVLWYPPLIYLFIRTLLMGFGIGERVEKTANLPSWLLMTLAGLAGGLVLALNLDSRVIDVGYAGVVGADLILDGASPYGNMPVDVGTGDTYGPLNYVLYVPFVLLFGFSGEWDFLPAAHALTACAFVGGAVAMFITGLRLSGAKLAAALTLAWAVYPYTLYSANNNTNDLVVAAISAIGLASASSAIGRGATIAAGFSVKLYPIILAPLWMMHDGVKRRAVVDFVIGGVGVFLLTFWVVLLDGHPLEAARLFYEKTIAFQGVRETPWTIYSQLPALRIIQQPLLAAIIVVAFIVAVWPRRRTIRRLAAFSAALIIGFELTTNYWFYPYVSWFEPFVFLALLPATNPKSPLDGSLEDDPGEGRDARQGRTDP